ncbi:MAG TPA: HAMP domain-containing sensor histidine kinase [Candidatus Nitrosocosmicus sp.]
MLGFSEIRHFDNMKGNFEVADEKEYVAVAALQEAQPIPQLLYSNIPEMIEQQQFIFNSFWERAIPAEQKIKEIEQGISPLIISVFVDYKQAERKEEEMIRNAKNEILILYSTSNAFFIQAKSGTLHLLNEVAQSNDNLTITILLPITDSIKQSSLFHILNKTNNIIFQNIAPSISMKMKSLIIDKKESLMIELNSDTEEKQTLSIGLSVYSNSESISLSYAAIFEIICDQSIIYEKTKKEEILKSEFIDLAAHELRTPIMPILNGIEILEENLGKKKYEYKREMDIITRNARRLQNLAENILQISKIESGQFNLCMQDNVDINALISTVIDDVKRKYSYTDKDKKVSIIFDSFYKNNKKNYVKENKEKCDKNNSNHIASNPFYIDCDSQRISQVVFNLLDNAMKFTSNGCIMISITSPEDKYLKNDVNLLSCTNDEILSTSNTNDTTDISTYENKIVVTIEDTGNGIDNKIKNNIFEKFVSFSTQGTGLGLYLSKKIIEAHGGKIWFEELNNSDEKNMWNYTIDKKYNTGSIFRFSLPISIDDKNNLI